MMIQSYNTIQYINGFWSAIFYAVGKELFLSSMLYRQFNPADGVLHGYDLAAGAVRDFLHHITNLLFPSLFFSSYNG